jgi:hypothetical protein
MKNQIKSIEDVKAFVQYLIDNDQLYHFEDEPSDVLCYKTGEAAFTPSECNLLNTRVGEICELNLLESAFEFALEHLESEDEMHVQAWRESLTQEQLNTI